MGRSDGEDHYQWEDPTGEEEAVVLLAVVAESAALALNLDERESR